jgi:hypothetical protein
LEIPEPDAEEKRQLQQASSWCFSFSLRSAFERKTGGFAFISEIKMIPTIYLLLLLHFSHLSVKRKKKKKYDERAFILILVMENPLSSNANVRDHILQNFFNFLRRREVARATEG